jgi:hypothetical protein
MTTMLFAMLIGTVLLVGLAGQIAIRPYGPTNHRPRNLGEL